MRKTLVQSLGPEDPLEEGTSTHSSVLAWRISWTEQPVGLQSMGFQRVGHNWATCTFKQSLIFHVFYWRNCGWEAVLSLSRLRELVMGSWDREAWHAAVHGFAKSRTWLSSWTELAWGTSVFPSSACRGSSMDGWFLRFGEICFVDQTKAQNNEVGCVASLDLKLLLFFQGSISNGAHSA